MNDDNKDARWLSESSADSPSTAPSGVYVITDSEGVDTAEQWSEYFEGKQYGVDVSYIHLSTTRVGVGPPLHAHPYPETVMIRQGKAEFTTGTRKMGRHAGQTLIIPANTPHTFRTLGPGRYESIALHLRAEFVNELLEDDNMFR
ncbi:MAG: cupin domain-containing protein [Actinomycetota bacterium]|nr:cupin domain-containing protein [Actinomycetota bacterium]